MASPGEDQATTFSPAEDEDIRGDGKKKKFKPLSAVRKLFSGRSKRKKESVVTVKAQSTTALHYGFADDDDEDDGGFKDHQSKATPSLAGNRSISEDSVFTPNTSISAFPTAAVSAESVPKSQLQSELLTKLSHRRSLYSDDDRDDGLPRSPVQPITTADVIHGEYLKPVTSGKRSQNQGSEQSLISVGSSENEEDNLFTSKWKHSVPAKKSGSKSTSKMSQGSVSEEPLDFSTIQKTELLKSTAAKDRISIKPQSRRASRLSRKKRETSQSLPSLNEESPLKVKIDSDIRNSKSSNNGTKDIHPKEPEPKENTAITSPALDIQSTTASTPSMAFLSSSAPSSGMLTSTVISADNDLNISKQEKDAPVKNVKKEVEDKKENAVEEKPKNFPRSSIKARAAGFESSSVSSKPLDTPKSEGTSLKVSDPNSNVTMSPREDYKMKRQNRSKTIPAGNTEEENATKVQRASSERVQTSIISVKSPAKEQELEKAKNESSQSPVSGGVKKLDTSKFSKQDSNSSSEPSWISMVRKKKEGQMVANDTEKVADETSKSISKPSDTSENTPIASNSKSSFSSVKSVFGQSSTQEKKWGSTNAGGADQGKENQSIIDSTKKEENLKESTNTKRPSIDVGTVRRESLEINVSELNSVKAMTSSFSNSSKRDSITSRWNNATNDDTKTSVPSTSSPAPYVTSSTSERAKVFSGASASTSTGNNSAKPPSSGISQSRFGSVKTSPTKSAEAKSVFSGRGGSVKTTTPSSMPSTSPASKSESVSSPSKPESQSSSNETKVVTTMANNVVSSSRPPPHPNSSSSSSQPSTKVVSPTSTSQSTSGFVKPISFGVKTSPFSVAKPFASNPASASSISSSVASSKHSPTASTSSPSSTSSVTSTSSSQSKTSPIRSHSSFTSSPVNKPEISTTPSSIYSRSTAVSKSTSMKASSPVGSQQEKETTTAKVPAWRANLPKKDVKIEIIEKTNNFTPSSQSSSLSSSSQNKNENGKKIGDNSSRVAEMAKTTEMRTSLVSTPEKTSHRSSKVLDLVKNFQNLQVSS